jgi:hypothetical protein
VNDRSETEVAREETSGLHVFACDSQCLASLMLVLKLIQAVHSGD